MLHKREGTEPEDGHTRASVSSPLSVEVHLDRLVENSVSSLDGLSVDALSEVADRMRVVLNWVSWLARIRLVERKEALSTALYFGHLFRLLI